MSGNRVLFIGGADELQLNPPNGKVYHPGDVVIMTDVQRASLSRSGLRFGAVPDEPPPAPEPAAPPPLDPVPPELAEKVAQDRAKRTAGQQADPKADTKADDKKGGS